MLFKFAAFIAAVAVCIPSVSTAQETARKSSDGTTVQLPVIVKADSKQDESVEKSSSPYIKIDAAQLQLIVNVEVASSDAGIIKSIGYREGDAISKGDVLVSLDRDSELANANSARSELDIAKEESQNDIDLRFAKVSEDVNGKVYQRSLNATKQYARSISKTELERLKLELEKSQLSGEQAERTATVMKLTVGLKKAQMELADVRLKNRTIESPVSGTVVQVYRQVGEWVQSGQPIARVIDLDRLRVSCHCALTDASPNSIEKEATFVYDGQSYKANVVFISPEIDPTVQDFIVWAEVENSEGVLKPGMNGSIELKRRSK